MTTTYINEMMTYTDDECEAAGYALIEILTGIRDLDGMDISGVANAIDADCYYCGLGMFGGMVAGGRDHIIHWCHEDPDEVVMEMSVRLMVRHECIHVIQAQTARLEQQYAELEAEHARTDELRAEKARMRAEIEKADAEGRKTCRRFFAIYALLSAAIEHRPDLLINVADAKAQLAEMDNDYADFKEHYERCKS